MIPTAFIQTQAMCGLASAFWFLQSLSKVKLLRTDFSASVSCFPSWNPTQIQTALQNQRIGCERTTCSCCTSSIRTCHDCLCCPSPVSWAAYPWPVQALLGLSPTEWQLWRGPTTRGADVIAALGLVMAAACGTPAPGPWIGLSMIKLWV